MDSSGTLALCETDEVLHTPSESPGGMLALPIGAEGLGSRSESRELRVSSLVPADSSGETAETRIAQLQEIFPNTAQDLLAQALRTSENSVDEAAALLLEMSHQQASTNISRGDVSGSPSDWQHPGLQRPREFAHGELVEALRRDGRWCKAYIAEKLIATDRSSLSSFWFDNAVYTVTWEDGHATDRIKLGTVIRRLDPNQESLAEGGGDVSLLLRESCKCLLLLACLPCAPCIAGLHAFTNHPDKYQCLDFHPCTPSVVDEWEVEILQNVSPRQWLTPRSRSLLTSPRVASTPSTTSPRSSDLAETFASARSTRSLLLPSVRDFAETKDDPKSSDLKCLCSVYGVAKKRAWCAAFWDNELLWNTASATSVAPVSHTELESFSGKYNPPAPLDEAACFKTIEGRQYRTGVGRDASPSRPGFRAGGGTSGPWWCATDKRYLRSQRDALDL